MARTMGGMHSELCPSLTLGQFAKHWYMATHKSHPPPCMHEDRACKEANWLVSVSGFSARLKKQLAEVAERRVVLDANLDEACHLQPPGGCHLQDQAYTILCSITSPGATVQSTHGL